MTTLKALDLFCGAGGASMGLHQAGFEVTGIDLKASKRYPFRFIQADALAPPVDLQQFDLIWASPPCQAHTRLRTMPKAKQHADLIPAVRELLKASGRPWVIENVPGADTLRPSLMLCGTMFGIGMEDGELWRHRWFEMSFAPPLVPQCRHYEKSRRVIGVYGSTGGRSVRHGTLRGTKSQRSEAMGIDWMSGLELSQAIPPVYSEFIARTAPIYRRS